MQWNGEVSSHFVDRVDFIELPSFTGNERTPEQQAEQSFSQVGKSSETVAPTFADLESDLKAGKSISVMDLSRAINGVNKPPIAKGKPSLLSRIDENKKKVARTTGADVPKTTEREV
jgi:hypothetical protein